MVWLNGDLIESLNQVTVQPHHSITVIGTVKLNVGTFIFLLDLGFALGVHSKVVDCSRQLIEGVTFLHR
jgi:hypothetical protein